MANKTIHQVDNFTSTLSLSDQLLIYDVSTDTTNRTTFQKVKDDLDLGSGSSIQNLRDSENGGLELVTNPDSTIASGTGAIALGTSASASGAHSFAEGMRTTASGYNAHVEGLGMQQQIGAIIYSANYPIQYRGGASGNAAHAEGHVTMASGMGSHTQGFLTKASGSYSHAEGYGFYCASSKGTTSFQQKKTIVQDTYGYASGYASHVQGQGTIANHRAQHVFGRFNIPDPSSNNSTTYGNYVEIVGNGVGSSTLSQNRMYLDGEQTGVWHLATSVSTSNARTLDWNGNEALAGSLTLGLGSASTAELTKQAVNKLNNLKIAVADVTNDTIYDYEDNTKQYTFNELASQPFIIFDNEIAINHFITNYNLKIENNDVILSYLLFNGYDSSTNEMKYTLREFYFSDGNSPAGYSETTSLAWQAAPYV